MPVAWTPDPALDADLAAPMLEAEALALAILLPALAISYAEAENKLPAAMAALAAALSVSAVRSMFDAAGRASVRRSSQHWAREVQRLDVATPTAREIAAVRASWVSSSSVQVLTLRDSVRPFTTRHIARAKRAGSASATVGRDLERSGLPARAGRMRGRAVVTSRTELSQLAGELAKEQQLSAGMTRFVWRSLRDVKVRDSHRELNGEEFAWAEPPEEGIPGQPVNCRCFAEAVLDLRALVPG